MKLLLENWRKYLNEEEDLSRTAKYLKHTALNLGMVARNLVGPQASDKDLKVRLEEIFNDLYYAAIPPWTHHTEEDLQSMSGRSAWEWFLCGYMSDEQYKEKCSKL
jgi:hypothetical protein